MRQFGLADIRVADVPEPETMSQKRVLQALSIVAILFVNRSLDDHPRGGLVANVRNLEVHVTIEADEPGILQVSSCNVIKR